MAIQLPNGFHPTDLIFGQGGWIDSLAETHDSPAVDAQEMGDLVDYLWDLLVSHAGPIVAKSAFVTWMKQHRLTVREWQQQDLKTAVKKRGAM